ncbi:MAG: Maf family protein, partial [Paludibacteraceae bacterium]|nr:Maf family protein [Paludibacteraceae bacterium]
YGKPDDEAEARQFLKQLSGKTHEVITGVYLRTARSERSFAVCTQVRFASLTDDEINYYTSRYNPVDKAGAYGIQEWIGAVGVEHINGSYFNVMGLPVSRLWKEIKSIEADEASAATSATPTT